MVPLSQMQEMQRQMQMMQETIVMLQRQTTQTESQMQAQLSAPPVAAKYVRSAWVRVCWVGWRAVPHRLPLILTSNPPTLSLRILRSSLPLLLTLLLSPPIPSQA